MFKGVGVCFRSFYLIFLKYPMKMLMTIANSLDTDQDQQNVWVNPHWIHHWVRWRITGWAFFLLVSTFVVCWWPLQTVWTQIKTDRMSVLIWIETVWHSDSVIKRTFWKCLFWKKLVDKKSIKNYHACKELNRLYIQEKRVFWVY